MKHVQHLSKQFDTSVYFSNFRHGIPFSNLRGGDSAQAAETYSATKVYVASGMRGF